MIRVPHYLIKTRHGVYYFRICAPKDLWHLFGDKRKYFYHSLKTRSKIEAVKLSSHYHIFYEGYFGDLRSMDLLKQDPDLVKNCEAIIANFADFTYGKEFVDVIVPSAYKEASMHLKNQKSISKKVLQELEYRVKVLNILFRISPNLQSQTLLKIADYNTDKLVSYKNEQIEIVREQVKGRERKERLEVQNELLIAAGLDPLPADTKIRVNDNDIAAVQFNNYDFGFNYDINEKYRLPRSNVIGGRLGKDLIHALKTGREITPEMKFALENGRDDTLYFPKDDDHKITFASTNSNDNTTSIKAGPLFSEVLDEFIEYKISENHWADGKNYADTHRDSAMLLIKLLGDKPVNSYTKKDAKQFFEFLKEVPKDRAYRRSDKNLSVDELLAMGVNKKKISSKTVNGHMSRISSIMKHAISASDDDTISNVFTQRMKVQAKDEATYHPFSDFQLERVFMTKHFFTRQYNRFPHHFWVPLIGLYMGARLNEICQLYLSDIQHYDGKLWCIDFSDEKEDQSIKNKASYRLVPIPQVLIDLGFIDYYKNIKAEGGLDKSGEKTERLFPYLSWHAKNKYGQTISKWFGDHLKRVEVKQEETKNKKLAFHSLRNNCCNNLKQQGVDAETREDIAGHEHDSEHKRTYNQKHQPSVLIEAINKVCYPSIDLKLLKKEAEKFLVY